MMYDVLPVYSFEGGSSRKQGYKSQPSLLRRITHIEIVSVAAAVRGYGVPLEECEELFGSATRLFAIHF